MPIVGEVDISGILERLGDPSHGLRPAQPQSQSDIFRASYGTVDMSTTVAIQPVPKIIWDVNHYYRSLGIGWPYTPTRTELRQGYLANNGQESVRLTYYMKQLLDPEIRAEYDATPLGKKFRDRYVAYDEYEKLAMYASKVSAEGTPMTTQELIDAHEREVGSIPERSNDLHWVNGVWDWGYYTFRSRKYDTDTLALWQQLLVSAFADEGINVVIAIGYIGDTQEEFEIHEHDDRTVFFLNEDVRPTMELSKSAVSKYKAPDQKGKK